MLGRLRAGASSALNGTLAALVALACPVAFGIYFWPKLLTRVDRQLEVARPIIAQEASVALQRPVAIGKLSLPLNLTTLQSVFQTPQRYENYQIAAENIELGCRPEEVKAAGQSWVVRAKRITALLSVPSALAGSFSTKGLKKLEIEGAEAVLVRDAKGKLNVETLFPESKTPPDLTQPPFQTEITVRDTRLRLRDFASLRAPGRLEENHFTQISATVNLSGPRTLRFIARLVPDRQTRNHIGQPVLIEGTARRGDPSRRPDSPTERQPRLRLTVDGADLDLPYSLSYALELPKTLRLTRGRASVRAELLLPGPPKEPLQVRVATRFREISVELKEPFPIGLQSLTGELLLINQQLRVNTTGTVLGERFLARASVLLDPQKPTLDASLSMPRLPLRRLLTLTKTSLPAELSLGPLARLEGARVRGPLTDPIITARVSDVSGRWQGLPALTAATADLTLQGGEVLASGFSARLAGEGTLSATGQYRFAQPNGKMLEAKKRRGTLEARLRNVSIDQVAALSSLKPAPKGRLHADFKGTLLGDRFTGSAQAHANDLVLANLTFPTVSARLSLDDTRFQLLDGVLAGSVGALHLTGGGVIGGELALEGQVVGADLGPLAEAFGLPGLGGTLSVSAAITKNNDTTAVQFRDITVLQPHYRIGTRLFVADAAYAERAALRLLGTGQVRAELDPLQPLRLYHSPTLVTLSGTITGGRDTAQLNLAAQGENVELEELLRQSAEEPVRFAAPWLRATPGYQALMTDLQWTGTPNLPASGRIRTLTATLTGDASNPQIQGEAELGRLLLASFPLDGGHVAFSLEDHTFRVYDLSLQTATGKIQGEASLSENGTLQGALSAEELDLEALSSLAGLVEKQLGITGAIAAQVALSGTLEQPRLVAQLTEARPLELAGLPLTNLVLSEIFIEPEIREGEPLRGRIRVPRVGIHLGTGELKDLAAKLVATNLSYNLENQQLSGDFALTEAHFQRIAALLQRGHFDNTPESQSFLTSLYDLPKNIDATIALTGSLAARFTPEGLRDRQANLELISNDIAVAADSDVTTQFKGRLSVRAALQDELLTFNSVNLTQVDAPDDEPAVVRALSHPRRDPTTGESVNVRSWLRLPYSKDEPLEYHVTLDANGLPLELGRLFDPEFPLRGRATVTVSADGTPDLPSISASFYANNLLVGSAIRLAGQANPPSLLINLARFQADLKGTSPQDWSITVSDGLVTHDKENLAFDGVVPVDHLASRVAAARPINLNVRSTDGIAVATLSPYLNLRGIELTGTVRGGVALTGTLNTPLLGGKVELIQATARFPSPPQRPGRDLLNPIRSLELTAELQGKEIRFPKASMTMAVLPPKARSNGKGTTVAPLVIAELPSQGTLSLAPSSLIRIENLEDFTRLFVRTTGEPQKPKLRGEFKLLAQFAGFQIDADNVSSLWMGAEPPRSLGLGEALAGRLDGQISIQGPLLAPLISTLPNQKLTLTNVVFQVPRNQVPEVASGAPLVFNPRFAIEVATGSDARLVNQTTVAGLNKLLGYQFQGTGTVSITGDVAAPRIEGVLVPTGGYYDYPLARFNVQRGGEIRMLYARSFEGGADQRQFDIRLTDVFAEAKVTVTPSAVSTARTAPRAGELSRSGGLNDDSLVGRSVRVTARFNGPLEMGGTVARNTNNAGAEPVGLPIDLSSDSNLSTEEIKSLLFPADMLVKAIFNNGSQQFLKDSFSILGGTLSGRYLLDPVTSQLRDFFGLDTFTLDYDFSGQANLFLSRRLAPPLDRVTIEVRRSFQTRAATGILLPQLYSINYELLQLRKGTRLQVGGSTNEQRDNQLFLRGTLRY